jgi:hypothetical protein
MDRDLVQSLQLQQVTHYCHPITQPGTFYLLVSTMIELKRAKIYGFTVVGWCPCDTFHLSCVCLQFLHSNCDQYIP